MKDEATHSSFIIHHSAFPRRAFTLIELMVAVAIVVVLMVGVAQVFQFTTQAVGASQQLSDAVRKERAANFAFSNDFQGFASDGPFIQFRSSVRTAYRNQADEQADKDQNVYTWDPIGSGTESLIPPAQINERNHRVDTLGFFARGAFRRQTGGGRLSSSSAVIDSANTFIAPQSSNEAWIWYGHLILPDNGAYGQESTAGNQQYPNNPFLYDPRANGSGNILAKKDNPNNYYATQWILGRMQMCLIQPTIPATAVAGFANGYITDKAGNYQEFIFRKLPANALDQVLMTGTLSPLVEGSWATTGSVDVTRRGTDALQRCRYDLAGTSISGFRQILTNFVGGAWASGRQYAKNERVSLDGLSYVSTQDGNTSQPPAGAWTQDNDWWSGTMGGKRFNCNPFVIKPIDSAKYSQQTPVFMEGCTQFIVEYAGDFLRQVNDPSQPNYGRVIDVFDNPAPGTHTDGETDFILVWNDANNNDLIDSNEETSVRREVRWYGLPRDIRNAASIPGYANNRFQHDLYNVVPLRDVVRTIASAGVLPPAGWTPVGRTTPMTTFADYPGAPFERFYTTIYPSEVRGAAISNANPTLFPQAEYYGVNAANMHPSEFYQCAWGPGDTVRPRMIRITITLDDPLSRFAEGQTFEYVFKLP